MRVSERDREKVDGKKEREIKREREKVLEIARE